MGSKAKTKSTTTELAGRGVLEELGEETAGKVEQVLAAVPTLRAKPATVTARKVFTTTRGVCLDVAAGSVQAGVHIEDEGGRMELYVTRHDSEPAVRLRTRFDADLAATLLADPHRALLLGHRDFRVAQADETPQDEGATADAA